MKGVEAGAVLGGKYRLESLIGRGGMGSVWRAEHLGLSAPVAVKLLDVLEAVPSNEALLRFHREARAAATIRSPHVVQILDHGVDQATNCPFIVMELMEGESLASRLEHAGWLPPAEVAHVFNHVARALVRAHEAGIVHRDLKPDNVFLVRNEDEVVAKVLDFGIAKATSASLSSDSATRTGSIMGTAYYMSPDQIVGARNIDFHTDLWAFGVMACECLTGKRPFEADTIGALTLQICVQPIPAPSSLGPVPPGFDAWFSRIVTRDSGRRFASARDAADALRLVLTGESPAVAAPSLTATLADSSGHFRPPSLTTAAPFSAAARSADGGQPASKSKVPWLIGGVGLLAAVAGALWLASQSSPLTPSSSASAALPAMPPRMSGEVAAFEPSAHVAAAPAAPSAVPTAPPGLTEPAASAEPTARPAASSAAAPVRTPAPVRAPVPVRAASPRSAAPNLAAPKPASTNIAPERDVIDERH